MQKTMLVSESDGFAGQLLVAMPQMQDPRFAKSVIYLCAHTPEGAMGLVLNKLVDSITFPDLLEQLSIEPAISGEEIRVHFGGPVESGRGFVLHTADYQREGTLPINSGIALTATVDILRDMARGAGPRQTLLALGYAGWGPGQLDAEIQANGWLQVPADEQLVFGQELETKWELALAKLGVDFGRLSGEAGHA
jgi:putative transcriptional regulator